MLAGFYFSAQQVEGHTPANAPSCFVTALPRPYMAFADLVFLDSILTAFKFQQI